MFVNKTILSYLPETSRLEFTILITTATVGEAKVELIINELPKGGYCTSKMTQRKPDEDQYSPNIIVNCTNWVDDDDIAAYEYFGNISII